MSLALAQLGEINGALPSVRLIYAVWGLISATASSTLLLSFVCLPELRTDNLNRVFFMSLADLGLALKFAFSGLIHRTLEADTIECYISGFSGTFFYNLTTAYYFMCALGVYSTLSDSGSLQLRGRYRAYYEHAFCWTIALICGGVPLAIRDSTGPAYVPVNDGSECWFRDSWRSLRLFDCVPLLVYILFAVYLLIHAFFKLRKIDMPQRTRRQLLGRMMLFVGVFVLTFSISLIDIAWAVFDPSPQSSPLGYLDLFCVIGSGVFNLLVWTTSPAFVKAFRSRCCPAESENASVDIDRLCVCCCVCDGFNGGTAIEPSTESLLRAVAEQNNGASKQRSTASSPAGGDTAAGSPSNRAAKKPGRHKPRIKLHEPDSDAASIGSGASSLIVGDDDTRSQIEASASFSRLTASQQKHGRRPVRSSKPGGGGSKGLAGAGAGSSVAAGGSVGSRGSGSLGRFTAKQKAAIHVMVDAGHEYIDPDSMPADEDDDGDASHSDEDGADDEQDISTDTAGSSSNASASSAADKASRQSSSVSASSATSAGSRTSSSSGVRVPSGAGPAAAVSGGAGAGAPGPGSLLYGSGGQSLPAGSLRSDPER